MTGNLIKIINARICFTEHLMTPDSYKSDPTKPKKYSCKLLVEKTNPVVPTIAAELLRLAREEWKDQAEAVIKTLKAENKICFYDGDNKQYDGFAGNYYISAANSKKPLFLRANPGTKDNPNLITDPSELYSGCYTVAHISFWTQNNSWGKRINANLMGLQFYRPGDAFASGSVSNIDEFEQVDDEKSGGVLVNAASMFT